MALAFIWKCILVLLISGRHYIMPHSPGNRQKVKEAQIAGLQIVVSIFFFFAVTLICLTIAKGKVCIVPQKNFATHLSIQPFRQATSQVGHYRYGILCNRLILYHLKMKVPFNFFLVIHCYEEILDARHLLLFWFSVCFSFVFPLWRKTDRITNDIDHGQSRTAPSHLCGWGNPIRML